MKFSRFIPISKTDPDKKMVYGFASTPSLDSQGEKVSVSAIRNALPEYLKFPTIREMHQPKAIGVTKETSIDSKKGLYIGAKIVDRDAWEKVKEGVFRGFSIGGKVKSMVDNVIKELDLSEISLVDRPANSEAIITVFKAETIENQLKVLKQASEEFRIESIEIGNAESILRMASELAFIRFLRESNKKSTTLVNRAIKALKQLVVRVLSGKDRKKFDIVIDRKVKSYELLPKWQKDYLKVINQKHTLGDLEEAKRVKSVLKEVLMTKKVKKSTKKVASKKKVVKEAPKVSTAPKVEVDLVKNKKVKKDKLLSRLEKIEQSLDKKPKIKKISKVVTLAKGLEKVASVLEKLASRVKKLESQRARTKTKSVMIEKSFLDEDKEIDPKAQGKIDKIQKRLNVLAQIAEGDKGRYVSEDLQSEAYSLMDEKRALQRA